MVSRSVYSFAGKPADRWSLVGFVEHIVRSMWIRIAFDIEQIGRCSAEEPLEQLALLEMHRWFDTADIVQIVVLERIRLDTVAYMQAVPQCTCCHRLAYKLARTELVLELERQQEQEQEQEVETGPGR
ncbi:hypothetical protein TELCIR_18479 [Teladorsagia circumcincta]|uniref:Uncharacterized protein n=1 Tax=Teladorsagia circumcincta TaxID=45464 RepID=A0A2G9TRE8_TELCI|nr:hypothetical protein TELCIR_18479 [Teladorsagia circumcincta]